MPDSIISQKIKELMNVRGLKAKELAVSLGMPYTTLLSLLTNVSDNPSSKSLIALSKYFGVSIEFLLGLEELREERETRLAKPLSIPKSEVQGVPVISWKKVKLWFDQQANALSADEIEWLYFDMDLHPKAFALRVENNSLAPIFPKHSVFLVNPQAEYHVDDLVLASINTNLPVVRELLDDGGDLYFKSISLHLPAVKFEAPHVVFGKILISKLRHS